MTIANAVLLASATLLVGGIVGFKMGWEWSTITNAVNMAIRCQSMAAKRASEYSAELLASVDGVVNADPSDLDGERVAWERLTRARKMMVPVDPEAS